MSDDPRNWHVEKCFYSARPWRIVRDVCPHESGHGMYACEVAQLEDFDHPNLGMMQIVGPVAFDRKKDAVAWLVAARSDAGGGT